METSRISFGDRVRIRLTEATETLGIGGRIAIVNGLTTPSVTGVEVIGTSSKDLAIAVTLEGQTRQLWFAEEVLEFVDHGAGTTVEIPGRKLIRDEHGFLTLPLSLLAASRARTAPEELPNRKADPPEASIRASISSTSRSTA
jgi:hypothetical protein